MDNVEGTSANEVLENHVSSQMELLSGGLAQVQSSPYFEFLLKIQRLIFWNLSCPLFQLLFLDHLLLDLWFVS